MRKILRTQKIVKQEHIYLNVQEIKETDSKEEQVKKLNDNFYQTEINNTNQTKAGE